MFCPGNSNKDKNHAIPINAHQQTGSHLVAMLGVVLGVGCKLLLPENPPPPTGVLVNKEERPVCLGVVNIFLSRHVLDL